MKFKYSFLLIILLLVPVVFSSCYPIQIPTTVQKFGVLDKSNNDVFIPLDPLLANSLLTYPSALFSSGLGTASFVVKNNYNFQVDAQITFSYSNGLNNPGSVLNCWPPTVSDSRTITIPANGTSTIQVNAGGSGMGCQLIAIQANSIQPNIFDSNYVTVSGLKPVTVTVSDCKKCPTQFNPDINCLITSDPCSLGSQCSGGYCIQGKCADNKVPKGGACNLDSECQDGFCNSNICDSTRICKTNQVRCTITSCVDKNSVSIGDTPICDSNDKANLCITSHIDEKSGKCSKADGQTCSNATECGTHYCNSGDNKCNSVEGICWRNDCGCDSKTQVECPNHSKCVEINSVGLNVKPDCRPEECKNGMALSPNTKTCLKIMGETCNAKDDCNSNFCIQNVCTAGKCPGSNSDGSPNCNCNKQNEFQSLDGNHCVTMGIIENGLSPPSGDKRECKSSYIDSNSKLCSDDPIWMIAIGLIIVGMIIYLVFKLMMKIRNDVNF